jgi:hypothetical protein
MRAFVLAAVALCLGLPVSAQEAAPDLSWLAGHWRSEADGRISEELWTAPEGGIMLGLGRTIRGGRASGFEFLMISLEGEAAYHAQPGGRPPVRFALAEHGPERAVFENPGHDFPQRIAYVRDGDRLDAEISLLDGSRAVSWSWTLRP